MHLTHHFRSAFGTGCTTNYYVIITTNYYIWWFHYYILFRKVIRSNETITTYYFPGQLGDVVIVKAAYAVSKAEAKAAAVVKSALKVQAVKVWKATNAAVKKAAKEAAEAAAKPAK